MSYTDIVIYRMSVCASACWHVCASVPCVLHVCADTGLATDQATKSPPAKAVGEVAGSDDDEDEGAACSSLSQGQEGEAGSDMSDRSLDDTALGALRKLSELHRCGCVPGCTGAA